MPGEGSWAVNVFQSIGTKKLEAASAKLKKWAEEQPNDGGKLCYVRVVCRGPPSDQWENWDWMPKGLRDSGVLPEHARQFGATFLLRSDAATMRCGHSMMPSAGVGQFLLCIQGRVLVLQWNSRVLMDLNIEISKQLDYLSGRSCAQFIRFADNHCKRHLLASNDSVWVPYGWQCMILTLDSPAVAEILQVPIFNVRMAVDHLSYHPQIARQCLEFASDNVKGWISAGDKPWVTVGEPYLQWWSTVVGECSRTFLERYQGKYTAPAVSVPALGGPGSEASEQYNLEEDLAKSLDDKDPNSGVDGKEEDEDEDMFGSKSKEAASASSAASVGKALDGLQEEMSAVSEAVLAQMPKPAVGSSTSSSPAAVPPAVSKGKKVPEDIE